MIQRVLYLDRIRPFYHSQFVKVITGVRRCGKSILLEQIAEDLIKLGIEESAITLISFEKFENRVFLNPSKLNEHLSNCIQGKNQSYILLDEVQLVDNFEAVVNSLQMRRNVSVFITGSNSNILSGELATLLGGRTLSFQVMPFNFREYVDFAHDSHDEKAELSSLLQNYLQWGGMPLVCAEQSDQTRMVVLDNLYNSIVLRDIVMRNTIKSPVALESVLDYLIANSSTMVSGNNIATALTDAHRKISAPSVYDYIRAITDAFIVSKVGRYDIRGKRALAFEEKIYVCDLGFFHLKKNRVKNEFNYIVETAVYNELMSRGYKVYVGKTLKGEIDFIVESDQGRCYIQAAYLLADDHVIEREFGAYDVVKDSYPKYVISMDSLTLNRNGVEHLSLLDFLMGRSLNFA